MKTAFLTTIFPMKKEYLYDFFDSLKNQTYKPFDIVVVNDGYENFDQIKSEYNQFLNIIELQYSNTPAKNREFGINYCIDNKYDVLIFGDSDDYFADNRVAKSLELLKDNDIVINDLSLFHDNSIYEKNYISNRIENNTIIDIDFILDKNIFGLSNTALLLKGLDKITIPNDLIVVDWYFFSLLLISNKKAVFTNETTSYYRQHELNTVGLKDIDLVSLKKGIEVKKKHYELLKNHTNIFDNEINKIDKRKLEIQEIKIKSPLWWELI